MNQNQAIKVLREWGKKGWHVFTKHELAKLFPEDSPKTFTEGLNRLAKGELLQRACRGIYINKEILAIDRYLIERIAKALRVGEYNYISLESMLSEYGVISQVPIDRLTIMTTGRKGNYKTPYGTIEFTHTKRGIVDILNNTRVAPNRPLRVATKEAAWRDLKRVGRNLNLVDKGELSDD
ncbi:MAG: hypothetical protein HY939_00270 [Gammaproteobacteria bacterium]|nr:hypothetical protein [Gammaproteobacteria bacterium]